MTDYEAIRRAPLTHLDYFTEWGGRSWSRMVRIALRDYLGGNLEGLRVLEIGARYGKMSCLFGLLGARVTGIDIHSECLEAARKESRRFGVDSRVEFKQYSGDLNELVDRHYDVIFAKSVIFLVPELHGVLLAIDQLLTINGRVVFIENGLGGRLMQFARKIKHWGRWDFSQAHFFTPERLDVVRSVFAIELVVTRRIPPIYLICGTRRRQSLKSTDYQQR